MFTDRLPVPATTFVGRTDELGEIAALLADPNCRLLTLVGSGGIGKTRLALQVGADQLAHFAHGVYFVPLAAVGTSDLLASAIASALQISFYSSEDSRLQIIRCLHEKQILLIMDNFEQMLDGVGLLTDILQAASGVKILVTSRERLNVQEEWVLTLHGLSFPDDQASAPLDSYSAVQLFIQRARQVQARFSLSENVEEVRTICQQVEGMPLGLELAATWLRVMSCRQIAAQMADSLNFLTTPLRNVPERHRSVRAVFEQSWNMLSPGEQNVLMRLSVFRGGFDVEAAEQIAGASLPLLAGLADKSLIRLDMTGRYDLHELLRQYGADKLDKTGEANATADCHLGYYLTLALQAEAHDFGREQIFWFDRLEAEFDNLRVALDWSLQNGQGKTGLRLAVALGWFLSERCHWSDGLVILERMLAANPDAPPSLRAKAFHGAGALAGHLGDHPKAQALCEQALALARAANDRWNLAWSLSQMAVHGTESYQECVTMEEESLALFREIKDPMGICHTLIRRSFSANKEQDYVYMRSLLNEALTIAQKVDDTISTAWVSLMLAEIFWLQDHDLMLAKSAFETTLSLFRKAHFSWAIANLLSKLAQLEQIMENEGNAEMLYEEALLLQQNRVLYNETVEEMLAGLAGVAVAHGNLERAAILLGAAGTVVENAEYYVDVSPIAVNFRRNVAEARAHLGADVFAEAWAAGKAMTREQTIAYALQGRTTPGETKRGEFPTDAKAVERRPDSSTSLGELFSSRELEVLRLIADGLPNREIAQELTLAPSTVKWYVSELLSKLGVANRTQAGVRARDLGLFI